MGPAPNTNSGYSVSSESAWLATFHICRHNFLLEECSSWDSTGRGLLCLVPLTSPHVPFPFADFALYPFPVINLSYVYDYILSPVRPPRGSLTLEVALGTLTQTAVFHSFSLSQNPGEALYINFPM